MGFVVVVGLPGSGSGTKTLSTISTADSTTTSTTASSTGSTSSTATTTSSSTSTSNSSGSTGPSIYVTAQFSNGTASPGVYTELANSSGEVATGYTPISFPVQAGQNYSVIVSDSNNHYFNQWLGGFASRVIPVQANATTVNLTAIFTSTPQPPPSTSYSISVSSSDLNGTTITGYYTNVRVDGYVIESGFTPITFTNLEPGLEYQVVAYWSGNYYFRNFQGTDLNRYELVTFNDTGAKSISLLGYYQYVPPSQAAALNIMAEFPNGTVIGTTFNNTDYIQHTPGMWLTVTPPGSNAPFTGTYTGGSILPFVLLSGDNYTVTMTLGYGNLKFAYWLDNNSSNNIRSVFLNSNTTLVAVYEET